MVQATSLPNLSVSKHMMHALRSDPGHSIASDLIPGGRSGRAVAWYAACCQRVTGLISPYIVRKVIVQWFDERLITLDVEE